MKLFEYKKHLFFLGAVCFSILFLSLAYKPVSAEGELVGYWKLDEDTAGDTVVDSSGNGFHGTPHGDPVPDEEVPDTISFDDPWSLSFDGTQWVEIPDDPAFAMTSATFSVWVKFTDLDDDMNMIAKRHHSGGPVQWQFGYSGGTNTFKVSLANDGGNGCCQDFNWSPNPGITVDTWYNISVVIDADNETITWYQDGVEKHSQDIGDNRLGTQADIPLTLGASYEGTGELLVGLLDDVRIYNVALSQEDVEDIAEGESGPGVPEPTPTPTPTSTPTPTPAPTSSTRDMPSLSSCTSSSPIGTPNLFQIDTKSTQATVFFAPAISNITNYYISYGYTPGDERFGTFTNQGNSSGVLSFTVNELLPNLTYYLKVRPFNDCAPGAWSNEMKITTAQNNNGIRYYKDFLSRPFSVFPGQLNILGASTFQCENYTISPGDSLWRIAQNKLGSGTKYQQLMDKNSLNSTMLRIGQIIKIGC